MRQAIKDAFREQRIFVNRALVAATLVIALLLVVVARLVWLQVIQHDQYITESRENRLKLIPVTPTRGLIRDRNGVILAHNLPSFSLEIIPERVPDLDDTMARLAKILPISEDDLNRFRRLKKQKRRFDSIPIRVRLNEEEVAAFSVNRHLFPGVEIEAKLLREYTHPLETAHVLGYVGRINEAELKRIDPVNYAGTTHIGKTGVEKSWEEQLHGKVGFEQVEVNARGRTARVLDRQPPEQGKELTLFLDIELQRIALQAFGDHNGAAVALDPNTGGVLAMVSKPGFDANLFVEGISVKDYKALRSSPDKPLFDRAMRGQYPPGSTVKPFIGIAGLETDSITFDETKFCPGYYQLPNKSHKYRDWKRWGHGKVSMDKAITESCDVYYYDLAHTMGIDKLHDYLAQFGFGAKTGIDLPGERRGILPSREWKKKARKQVWFPGETLIMGIGQGYFLATPLQLASAVGVIATNGLRVEPRVVASVSDSDTHAASDTPVVAHAVPVEDEQHWRDVRMAMNHVIEGRHGTARRLRNDSYRLAGKTGTAQVFTVKQDEEYNASKISKKNRDHALFVAFAPLEAPRIAVAVLVENGGHGGSVAAPIAKAIMDYYLLGKKPKPPVEKQP